jgi:hypothetical protein
MSLGADRSELERRRDELAGQVAELHWDLGGLAYEMAVRNHFRNDLLLQRAALLQERDAELAEVERRLAHEGGSGAAQARKAWARVLPPPPVSALLVAAFLGFGALAGAAAGSRSGPRRPPPRVLVAQAPPTTSATPPPTKAEATPAPSTESEGGGESEQKTGRTSAKSAPPRPSGGSGSKGSGSSESGSGGGGGSSEGSGGGATKLPHVKHVFVVMLSDEPYASAFGPASTAPYLAHTLERKGELLVRYYAVAHEQLANGVALLSGQGPTSETAANCPTYADIAPGTVGAEGQVTGHGCVYPRATQTLAGQLQAKHLQWRAYVQGMDEAGAAQGACAHPALGAADPSAGAPPTGAPPAGNYATFRNPFVYFHALTDARACAANDVGLDKLSRDLAGAHAPSFAYVVPDRCHDGNPAPCAPGKPAGMAPADGFLAQVVPKILASRAYKDGGLLAITTDEAPSSGEFADSSSCCGQPRFPNLPPPTGASAAIPSGGGQVGALLLSPFVKGGGTDQGTYNHFSLLRTIEDLFGLSHLGYAGGAEVNSFAVSLFSGSK